MISIRHGYSLGAAIVFSSHGAGAQECVALVGNGLEFNLR